MYYLTRISAQLVRGTDRRVERARVGRLCTVTGWVVSAGWVRRRWWVVVV